MMESRQWRAVRLDLEEEVCLLCHVRARGTNICNFFVFKSYNKTLLVMSHWKTPNSHYVKELLVFVHNNVSPYIDN